MTCPPFPPFPPSGPMNGLFFSRRKDLHPWPPSPPLTLIIATSKYIQSGLFHLRRGMAWSSPTFSKLSPARFWKSNSRSSSPGTMGTLLPSGSCTTIEEPPAPPNSSSPASARTVTVPSDRLPVMRPSRSPLLVPPTPRMAGPRRRPPCLLRPAAKRPAEATAAAAPARRPEAAGAGRPVGPSARTPAAPQGGPTAVTAAATADLPP
mmetsp:Transcript_104519/g.233482  ORF Transcript_104519/g.233482 Transcript_104519/m.233482 type:complete len:207 (-) Transcript_104519:170-790(-)